MKNIDFIPLGVATTNFKQTICVIEYQSINLPSPQIRMTSSRSIDENGAVYSIGVGSRTFLRLCCLEDEQDRMMAMNGRFLLVRSIEGSVIDTRFVDVAKAQSSEDQNVRKN